VPASYLRRRPSTLAPKPAPAASNPNPSCATAIAEARVHAAPPLLLDKFTAPEFREVARELSDPFFLSLSLSSVYASSSEPCAAARHRETCSGHRSPTQTPPSSSRHCALAPRPKTRAEPCRNRIFAIRRRSTRRLRAAAARHHQTPSPAVNAAARAAASPQGRPIRDLRPSFDPSQVKTDHTPVNRGLFAKEPLSFLVINPRSTLVQK